MLRKKAETMRFFKEMEANIYRKLSGIEDDVVAVPARDASDGTRTRSGTIVSRVRTISSIDGDNHLWNSDVFFFSIISTPVVCSSQTHC